MGDSEGLTVKLPIILWLLCIQGGMGATQAYPSRFTVETFEGHGFDQSKFAGKPILFHFWAPWCHSCSTVLWDLDPILEMHPQVQFLSINIEEDQEQARTHIQKHQLYEKYKTSFYTAPSKSLLEGLQIESVPTIVIVGATEQVVYESRSHINAPQKFAIIKALKAITLGAPL